MKRLWALVIAGIVFSTANANVVLVQGPDSHSLDYRATLFAHPDYTSPAQQLLKSRPNKSERQKLISLFSEAQKAFLDDSPSAAEEKFRAVIGMIHSEDWDQSDRVVFLFSLLRLAQLATNADSRDKWLSQSLLLGNSMTEQSMQSRYAQIPPPILARREELRAQLPSVVVSRPTGWSEVLINGQACAKQNCGVWTRYPGNVRVTFLSDRYQAQTLIIDISELTTAKPNQIPWITGDCEHSRPSSELSAFTQYKVFWTQDCDRPKALNLSALTPPPRSQEGVANIDIPKPHRQFYKSKWFWVAGLAVVTTAVIVIQENNKKSTATESEPTTSYGVR